MRLERKPTGKTSWLRTQPWGTLTLKEGAEKEEPEHGRFSFKILKMAPEVHTDFILQRC